MSRAIIIYGDRSYSVADDDPDTLRDRITAGLADGGPFWLTANATEGRFTRAQLLITASTEIAILDEVGNGSRPQYDTAAPAADDLGI